MLSILIAKRGVYTQDFEVHIGIIRNHVAAAKIGTVAHKKEKNRTVQAFLSWEFLGPKVCLTVGIADPKAHAGRGLGLACFRGNWMKNDAS